MNNQNTVLKAVLECGTDDLYMLDDIGYDLGEIVENMVNHGIKPTLNNITANVFHRGAVEMVQRVDDRICELKTVQDERELDSDEENELNALESLDPRKDIEWFCNCLNTQVFFVEHEDIYRKYMAEAISDIEDNMGFSF